MSAQKITIGDLKQQLTQGYLRSEFVLINGAITKLNIDDSKDLLRSLQFIWYNRQYILKNK